nr:bis(5'-nucleosyl)-tetraphosphatase (symmetrical) YqeK [uncultured Faecalimonas sp.]
MKEHSEIRSMKKELKLHLDSDRYEHTLGVMYTAASLAMCHGEDIGRAMIAGLLHDCAKGVPNSKKVKLCEKYQITVTESEKKNPELLHAKLGAYMAVHKYHVTDETIAQAITSHTTGRPGMTLLEKIIYIADFIEPGRKEIPKLDEIRKMAFQNIDQALFTILENSLAYLRTRDKVIDPTTEKTYLYYKELFEKKTEEA